MIETLNSSTVADELVRATETAAIASAPWVGYGDKIAADQAAVDAFETVLRGSKALSCEVVIGEGVKDEAPMLAHGDILGTHSTNFFDLAVDPIDGTTFAAEGREGAISVAALGKPGSFLPWSNISYTKKLVVGPQAAKLVEDGDVRIDADPAQNMRLVARALGKQPTALTVAVLDRERNRDVIAGIRSLGAQPLFLEGGDIIPALQTSMDRGGIDMLYGSGGSPEAVLAAAGVAALGGNMQAMWDPQTPGEMERADNLDQLGLVLELETLIGKGEAHFALTAITSYQALLKGCHRDTSGNWIAGTSLYFNRSV